MSNNILPLLLLLAWGRRDSAAAAPAPRAKAPPWPTPASPPPMPAFAPQAPATADTATPLTELHHEALAPPAAHKPAAKPQHTAPAPKPAAKPTTPAQAARAAASHARAAATHAASSTAKHAAQRATKGLKGLVHFPSSKARVDMRTAVVADLQAIMIARGAQLSHDGLWGPKTASHWQTLAMSKGLPADISRVGPKIAKVATQTYDALAVPPIP